MALSSEQVRAVYRPAGPRDQRVICPACSGERKPEHRNLTELSITDEGDRFVYFCHHCGVTGAHRHDQANIQPVYASRPQRLVTVPITQPDPEQRLSDEAVGWFMTRGISEDTLKLAPVWSAPAGHLSEAIWFGYETEGQVYAAKLRAFPDKKFSMRGSASTFWLADQIKEGEDLIIVEGEMDALSLREVDCPGSVVSVPNGASVPREDREDGYLWAARDAIKRAKRVIIATDNDAPGRNFADELARRVGKARCWKIDWADCKDANDVLTKKGAEALKALVANPEPWPIAGIYDADHFAPTTLALFKGGLSKGRSTGFGCVDEIFTVMPGQLNLVTGAPNSGKTTWINSVLVNLAKAEGWKFAIYSSETPPEIQLALLAQLYVEKPFFDGPTPKMSEGELNQALVWVKQHFYFLHRETSSTYKDIIELLEAAALRWGINGFVVDPVGYLSRPDTSDVEWAGQMLEAFKSFAVSHDCASFLVAHPHKLQMREDGSINPPGGYQVSGSSHYFNRPDCGLTVHRQPGNNASNEIIVWKGRFAWIAKQGATSLFYDPPTGRFSEYPFGDYVDPGVTIDRLKANRTW